MTRVKICGITTVSDAHLALEAGADSIGLVFASSPRKVSVAQALKISRSVGPWMGVTGVFVDEKPEEIIRIARECRLSEVQLHGSESQEALERLVSLKVIKTIHVDAGFSVTRLKGVVADAFLFDNRTSQKQGGTGKVFDWNLLKNLPMRIPVIISGGLNGRNIAQAVKLFRPYGVDVSSGVEKRPGMKDPKLVKEFVQNAKRV